MLVKKELEQTAIMKYPILPRPKDKRARNDKYVAAAEVLSLKRSGEVLVIDVFLREDKTLKLRFFSDGKAFLVCKEWPVKKWEKRLPSNLLENQYSYFTIEARESDIKIAHEILKDGQTSWHYVHGMKEELDSFASEINRKKQEQAMERKYAKMGEHFGMFPSYPADLIEYCEKYVFGQTSIFIDKLQKVKSGMCRKAVCGHCGHKFTAGKEVKTGKTGICPKCHMPARYRAAWSTNGSHQEKAKICIAYRVDNQLLTHWTKITRWFDETKVQYRFDDYYRNLHLKTPSGSILYAYDYKPMMNWGENWYRQRNGDTHHGESFVYANNLREVFGETYYHVDLQEGLKACGQLSFSALLNNLRDFQAAEYLFKMGMPALASSTLLMQDLGNRAGFTEVLGVSKQYHPLYRKYNVTLLEHRIIKSSRTWVDEDSFLKLRVLKPDWSDQGNINDLLETMSFERFVNYFTRQKEYGKKKIDHYMMLYRDYISMSESLKVDLSRKSVRFPRNIKEAHDLILPRFNQVKHEVEDANFKQAQEKLYAGMKEYAKGNYCIVFPTSRSEFITEGQTLNHCVGNEHYYKNHLAGTSMIFFVRQAAEREKPYFTMEIDMRELKIRQLYGFGDCTPPPEVRQFANEFLRKLKPKSAEERLVS
ncbi:MULTISPECIES: PcfJ domain-containing protein [unclassified Dehalobacter]|uniref:PcfJ domain-containing protein n=1 Tax=unclassified Dehalobacter TaxID=2635733 RepID=UPI00104ED5AC|nr:MULTISPECIES: PcfJ domain-containing protein [unclassified Dehalobacter]TCX51967.1 hypothetical protein C1I36_06515 [Dehalobacter sp. 14DCB1]TCX53027.1 hypothetical protein C1I38_08195 [Dehalobacter sp. 12DCB1]